MRDAIVAEAREWLGTRWLHQASLKGVGCDCIGLISGVAKNLGIPEAAQFQRDPRFRAYGRTPDPVMLRAALAEYLDQASEQLPGDILLMNHERYPQPHHFGFVSDQPDYLIHAYAGARKVVEHRLDQTWRGRIIGTYRFRGL